MLQYLSSLAYVSWELFKSEIYWENKSRLLYQLIIIFTFQGPVATAEAISFNKQVLEFMLTDFIYWFYIDLGTISDCFLR
jgi:hypothetical protein